MHVLPEGGQGREAVAVQGTIKMFDPATHEGIVVRDTDREELVLAMDALKQYEYSPARQGGRPVASKVTVTIKFWFDP